MSEASTLGTEQDELHRVRELLRANPETTPLLVLDADVAARRYRAISDTFTESTVHYAVKANPHPRLVRTLVRAGASFDVASCAEIETCLSEGAAPCSLSYGNTIKKSADIAYAYSRGVRQFVFDCEAELRKLAECAPGAQVLCRILASSAGARWPLSQKFGCTPDLATALLRQARALKLDPVGVSFHVGSQQLDPSRWDPSIAQAAAVFDALSRDGIQLGLLNVGGGFPVSYADAVPPIESYARAIRASVARHFGTRPRLAIEPGRYVAAEAGILRSQVVLVAHKSTRSDDRWVYLDVGRFGGLAETEREAIKYQIRTTRDGGPCGQVVLAGPTCDSVDILAQDSRYDFPLDLSSGDFVEILAAGAYTVTYASIGFNGFPPPSVICMGADV